MRQLYQAYFSPSSNKDDDLMIHQVFAWKTKEYINSNTSRGNKHLDFHTDQAYLSLLFDPSKDAQTVAPDILAFLGLRRNDKVQTKLIFCDDIMQNLNSNIIDTLKLDQFYFRKPDAYFDEKKTAFKLPILLKDNNDNFLIRWDETVDSRNRISSENAIKMVRLAIQQSEQHSIFLSPGDFMMFKNKRVLHAREAFNPKYDGTDRWLLRIYGLQQVSHGFLR